MDRNEVDVQRGRCSELRLLVVRYQDEDGYGRIGVLVVVRRTIVSIVRITRVFQMELMKRSSRCIEQGNTKCVYDV